MAGAGAGRASRWPGVRGVKGREEVRRAWVPRTSYGMVLISFMVRWDSRRSTAGRLLSLSVMNAS